MRDDASELPDEAPEEDDGRGIGALIGQELFVPDLDFIARDNNSEIGLVGGGVRSRMS